MDASINTELDVERGILVDHIIDAIDTLPFKEQEIFIKSMGINCHHCGSFCPRQTYMYLANLFQLSGESSAEKQHKKARLAILTNLADKKTLNFITAVRKSENSKIVTYSYLPQNDKSGEKGIITINKADFTYIVEPIAEWDTIISKRYAERVVSYLKDKKDFPKNVLYVWAE